MVLVVCKPHINNTNFKILSKHFNNAWGFIEILWLGSLMEDIGENKIKEKQDDLDEEICGLTTLRFL